MHRIRFAMNETKSDPPLANVVEVDEVFIGGKPRHYNNSRKTHSKREKSVVLGMVERGGKIRPRIIPDVTAATLKEVVRRNIAPSSTIYTDDASGYRVWVDKTFGGGHQTVRHSTFEYARGDVHTNTIEGFFGMLRRGLDGIYHSVSRKHLHRYLSEFEFRYNHREESDGERARQAIRAANGKRLLYKEVIGSA